jgi:formyltetrahydrofolate deformylase
LAAAAQRRQHSANTTAKRVLIKNMTPLSAILLMHCPDQKGLVSAVTEFIARNGGNILSLEQHVDPHVGEFFMRVAWDLTDFAIPRDKVAEFFRVLIAERFKMDFALHFSDERMRLGVFVSKTSHCLYEVLGRVQSGEWPVDVAFVAGNHRDLEGIAQAYKIPFVHFPITAENRAAQEQAQLALIAEHKVDLVILARYMIILSEGFARSLPGRVINIHHAFLPAFIGARPYHRAYERGVKLIGATAHYVTADLDEGPIIDQDVVRVSHLDGIDALTRKGGDVEKITLARAIRRHIERKTLVFQNRVIVFE